VDAWGVPLHVPLWTGKFVCSRKAARLIGSCRVPGAGIRFYELQFVFSLEMMFFY
jgi:hypothetical protein